MLIMIERTSKFTRGVGVWMEFTKAVQDKEEENVKKVRMGG